MDLQRSNISRDPYKFPGGNGRLIRVRTNLFDMKFDKRTSIGKFEVVALQKMKDRSLLPVQSRKLYSLFKNNYATELQNYETVEGYPTEHGIIVYTIPSYPRNSFPPKQDRQNKYIQISAEFRGEVQINEWENFDNELRRFLKRAALQSIAQLFENHGFTLMKKAIYTFEGDRRRARFPKRPLNDIFDLVSGFKIGFETNVPLKQHDKTSRNMVSIDLTQTVCTRTNIPLFECYIGLCTLPFDAHRVLRPQDLHEKKLDTTSVSLLNRVFANTDVYINGEEQRGGRNVLYKFVEICNKQSTRFSEPDGRTIVRVFEDRFRIQLQFPWLNAVKIKIRNKIKHVPMELIYLSDRPQRIAVSALNILAELNQRVKELAAVVPGPRWEFIESTAGRLQAELMDTNERNLLKSIGIQINDAPIEVDARVLDVPLDTYSKAPGTLAMPFKDPVDYVIIDFHRVNHNDSIIKDVDNLMERLYNLRIYMAGKRCVNFFQCTPRSAATDLDNVVKWHDDVGLAENKRRVLLYIVVVDNEPNNDLYQTIKQKLDFNAMINQVITVGVLRNAKMSYRRDLRETSEDFTYNIALNINAKLGGVNCIPSDDPLNLWNEDVNRDELFMFIGIDTRLSSQKSKLGLVGITASIDNKGTRYNAYAIITNGVQKYCSDYKSILFKAFNAYEGATGQRSQFPTKILVFRAGMNEYDLTKGEGLLEISHIENVIRQYMDEYELRRKPLITYIGYHRSHGVKFYDLTMKTRIPPLKSDTDLEGVKLNVPPGTVIDSEITNPNCFYFVSHETFMGTTKPAKYTIVVDNINFKADNLLAIVYQLCRLMPQTKRSFRKPVPIGLASKLLERCLTVQPNLFESMDKEELFYINPDFVSRPFYI